jgi:dihydrofolate reductase
MRKLVETTFITLDGVISNPQEWGPPYWDDQHHGFAHDLLFGADALLLGRVTYEGFAEAWSARSGPEADVFNTMPKYVASRTLTEVTWANSTLLRGDVAEEVARLKEQPGKDIMKWGTGELDRTLVEHGLVDEFHFWYFPVIVGAGKHLFEGAGFDTTHLKLADLERFDSGIVVHIYVPK